MLLQLYAHENKNKKNLQDSCWYKSNIFSLHVTLPHIPVFRSAWAVKEKLWGEEKNLRKTRIRPTPGEPINVFTPLCFFLSRLSRYDVLYATPHATAEGILGLYVRTRHFYAREMLNPRRFESGSSAFICLLKAIEESRGKAIQCPIVWRPKKFLYHRMKGKKVVSATDINVLP